MELKYGDEPDYIRNLFEKVISISLKQKSMKLIFKKFLEFEQENGDSSRQKYVKKKAMEYMENLIAKKGGEKSVEGENDE